jgi:c-di-GMP-binding flagellar brake protein YcgR
MAKKLDIQINQTIRVALIGVEEDNDWYISDVQDLDNETFSISIPTRDTNPLKLYEGDTAKISFIHGQYRYEFETLVVGRRYDNIRLYVLALPKEYKRIQLRDFVRIPIVIEMYYAELPEDGQPPLFKSCDSLDLSAGGVRIFLENGYAAGTRLLLKFNLPIRTRPEKIEVMSKVVRSWQVKSVNRYHIGLKFVEISPEQQDLIDRFIMERFSQQGHLK